MTGWICPQCNRSVNPSEKYCGCSEPKEDQNPSWKWGKQKDWSSGSVSTHPSLKNITVWSAPSGNSVC